MKTYSFKKTWFSLSCSHLMVEVLCISTIFLVLAACKQSQTEAEKEHLVPWQQWEQETQKKSEMRGMANTEQNANQSPSQESGNKKKWVYIEESRYHDFETYIDVQNISCSSEGVLKVWTKWIHAPGSTLHMKALKYLKDAGKNYNDYSFTAILEEMDCMNCRDRDLDYIFYDKQGNEIDSRKHEGDWRPASEGTVAGEILKKACGIKECM